ncbi:hypothetical protein ACLOJK_000829 [Asimina triloba]
MNEGGGLREWEEVGPASTSSSHPQRYHGQRDWEILDDYDCSVFPPSSHEGLLLPSSEAADAVAGAASPPPPSAVDRGEHWDQDQDEVELPLRRQSPSNSRFLQLARCRLEFGFQHFYSKLLPFLRPRRPFPSAAALLPSAATAAALVAVLFFVRRWRRRRQGLAAENNDSLLRLVREHDEVKKFAFEALQEFYIQVSPANNSLMTNPIGKSWAKSAKNSLPFSPSAGCGKLITCIIASLPLFFHSAMVVLPWKHVEHPSVLML